MNDTYDPVSETGEITFAGIGRLIKRSALRVVLYVLIGVLAASLIVLPIKMFVHTDPSVTARVEFVYSGIENGLDPFGTVFDKNQIKNNSVLTAAIAASGLESEIPVVADLTAAGQVNALLSSAGNYIVGRMGLPYKPRGVSIISVVLDAPADVINALGGRLNALPGVTAKALFQREGL